MPKTIRIWDLERELSLQDIQVGLADQACITSLASDSTGSRTVVAGCSDGSIRIFDYRNPPRYG
jgi:WD40 repeat protein